jgi:hypothetical protein
LGTINVSTEIISETEPETCRSVGLDCGTCTKRTASELAALCPGLNASALESSFFRMYPSSACASMMPVFASVYFAMTEPAVESILRLAAAAA